MQLRGDLDARGAPTADHERQQPLALLGRRLRQRGALEALGDVAAELGGVLDRLEEERVLLIRERGQGWKERKGKNEREGERKRESVSSSEVEEKGRSEK